MEFIRYGIVCILILIGIGVVNATEVELYENMFYSNTLISYEYQCNWSFDGYTPSNYKIDRIVIRDANEIANVKQIVLKWSASKASFSKESDWVDCQLRLYGSDEVVANVTHGYQLSADGETISYIIVFNDFNANLIGTSIKELYFTETIDTITFEMVNKQGGIKNYLDSGQVFFGYRYNTQYDWQVSGCIYNRYENYGDPNHEYNIYTRYEFMNEYNISYILDGAFANFYKICIKRSYNEYASKSMWEIKDDNYTYLDEDVYDNTDECVYARTDAKIFYLFCQNQKGMNFSENVSIEDLGIEEEGEVVIIGKTLSSNGAIISNVSISTNDYSTKSNYVGDYQIYTTTGIITIYAEKEGYYSKTEILYINKSGQYYHDIILIPKDEYSICGIVYDAQSYELIQSAMVKIYNLSFEEITFTNEYGFYYFENLNEGEYNITASAISYYDCEPILVYISSNNTTIQDIYLVSITGSEMPTVSPSPTPSSSPPSADLTTLTSIVTSILGGVSEETAGWFVGLFITLFTIALLGGIIKNTIGLTAGLIMGVGFSVTLGYLPLWLLITIILIVIASITFRRLI